MPITALPQNTVRAIGSTSVITDPCSIVKELLENALDASASSVFVEVSQNTLDVIQVKDNGHGISSEDHAVVCRRTFTSKIQTVEDLRKIGGSSLGFRGEALASVAEMSGSVAVTTRVAAEVVGSAIKYGRNGELISSQRASHPVGTTVRITDILKHIPVRRQTALKSAGKTLSKIKKLLHAYAVCQPTKRLSLKVIKSKTESNNWMYIGSQSACLTDAALKVVGTDVVSNCTIKEWPLEDNSSDYKVVALLAKDNADFTKVNNTSQYFGVDGRPLASGRGITRDITKLYRNYLRSANSKNKEPTSINDPFLCLQIQCPPGSYDANIEPAKDDVLFEDPQRILSLVEGLFRDMYGDLAGLAEKKQLNKGKDRASYNDGFELLMPRKIPASPASRIPATVDDMEPPSITPSLAFRRPSLPKNSQGIEVTPQSVDKDSQNGSRRGSGDRGALNPWLMTQLNAPLRTPMRTQAGPSSVPLITSATRRESVRMHRGENQISPTSSRSSALPSPPASNSKPNSTSTSPMDAPPDRESLQTSPTASIQSGTRRARERDRERYGNGALDTLFSRITQPGRRENEDRRPENEQEKEEPLLTQKAQARFISLEQSPSDTPKTFEDLSTQNDTDGTPATLASSQPLTEDQGFSRGPIQTTGIANKRQEFPDMEERSARLHRLSSAQPNPELEQALDFERRKKEAIIQRREEIKNRIGTPPSTNSPHHSRYLAARASLNSRPNEQQSHVPFIPELSTSKSPLSPFDPRAYLIRKNVFLQKLHKDEKARRIQTSKLPLEKIPDGHDLHNVCLSMPFNVSELTNTIDEHLTHDLYTQCGYDFAAFTEPESEDPYPLNAWKHRLSDLVNKNYETTDSEVPRLDFDFSNIPNILESD